MRRATLGRVLPLAIALTLSSAATARAELISLQFAGTITAQDGETDPILRALFPIGGSATWLLTYERTTPESGLNPIWAADPSFGFYESTAIDWEGQIAGHAYTLPADATQRLFVERDQPGLLFDNSINATSQRGAIAGDLIAGSDAQWFGQAFDFHVRWPGASPFASDALPGSIPGIAPDGSFLFYLHNSCPQLFGCTERQLRVSGTITSVASVPEPGTLALFVLGAIAAAATLRSFRFRASR
jgi:hypothetical protein